LNALHDASPGFRRRRRDAGAAVLMDETAAVIQADALGWAARAFLPTLPLALLGLLYVHLHRVVWAREAWSGSTTIGSLLVSAAVVLAIGVRAVGHGHAARAVSAALDPGRAAPEEPVGFWSLAAVGWLAAAACWLGGFLAILPGMIAAAFFLPAFAVAACEGRDAGSTLQRLSSLPRGTLAKGMSSVMLFCVLAVFVWVDVIAGTQVLLLMVRALTGADVDVLARLLGPTNGAFLLSAAVVAGFVLDGFWCVYAAVFYVDARLSQSGADLLDRWTEVTRPSGAAVAVLLLALVLPGSAIADETFEGVGLLGGEVGLAEGVFADPEVGFAQAPEVLVMDLEYWREQLEVELDEYKTTGFEDLDGLRESLRWETQRTISMPGGPLTIDASILADELPEWIHTDDTELQARLFLDRLDAAIARLKPSQEELDPSERPGEPPPAEPDVRALLNAELDSGDYRLGEERVEGDAFRDSFQERWRVWFEDLWRRLSAYEPPPQKKTQPLMPEIDGRIVMAAVAGLLALIIILFLLGQTRTLRVSAPESDAAEPSLGGDLPDARQRSPLGWRGRADKLAAEGLFREAIRAQFLAVLARLDRTGEIDYRQERTNGEHLRTFRGIQGRREHFGDATWTFEVAWYGEAAVGPVDYTQMTTVCDGLVLQDRDGNRLGAGASDA
jgi:hypothetical protein